MAILLFLFMISVFAWLIALIYAIKTRKIIPMLVTLAIMNVINLVIQLIK